LYRHDLPLRRNGFPRLQHIHNVLHFPQLLGDALSALPSDETPGRFIDRARQSSLHSGKCFPLSARAKQAQRAEAGCKEREYSG
jgi:hypothetical protein